MRQISMVVPSISCQHCKATIESTLRRMDGVEEALVDIANKRVALRYDNKRVVLAELEAALFDEGYEVSDVH